MAYPPLIQKIMDLAARVEDTHLADIRLSKEMLRMSNRLAEIELAIAENGAPPPRPSQTVIALPPEGLPLPGGALLAPLVIRERDDGPVEGAAITALISEAG